MTHITFEYSPDPIMSFEEFITILYTKQRIADICKKLAEHRNLSVDDAMRYIHDSMRNVYWKYYIKQDDTIKH